MKKNAQIIISKSIIKFANSVLCYRAGKWAIFTQGNITKNYTRWNGLFSRAANDTFLSISVEKGRIHMRAMARAKLTILINWCKITLKMMLWCNDKNKEVFVEKKFEKDYFETQILITKIYNTINQCDIVFVLLALLDRNRDKIERNRGYYSLASNKKFCACALGTDSK